MKFKFLLRFAMALLSIAGLMPFTARATPGTGYWWNPAESGRGFVIEIQGSNMFMAGFLYGSDGKSTWVASNGPMSSPTQYTGPLITYQGGQTLNGAYQAPSLVSPPFGNISITFINDTNATLTLPGGSVVPIQRLDIVPGGSTTAQPTAPQPGWWWNPAEPGRGFAVEVQGNQMWLAAYMYDANGNPTWYLANSAMTSDTLYQGNWTQYFGGQTLLGTYHAPTSTSPAGPVTLQFGSSLQATMTLPNGLQIPFSRFRFGGPVLYAFSPTNAAPASPISITTSNIDITQDLSLTLFDQTGYSVTVPLSNATPNLITAAVPPYISVSDSSFQSGTVSVKLTQGTGATAVDSNVLPGFVINYLPGERAPTGQATLSLIIASLSEAQLLQNSVKGTPQDTPAVEAAIATQIDDLQQLVTNVQNVVSNGASFSLGAVGGVNIEVTPTNIGDVDRLILATLNALSATSSSSLTKTAQTTAGAGCMAQEANAFAQAMFLGSGDFNSLAQQLVAATRISLKCATLTGFTTGYQTFAGAGAVGLGITDDANATALTSNLPGAALFAAATSNVNIELGLNAIILPAFSTQVLAVQNVIGSAAALTQPTTNDILTKSSGPVATNLNDTKNLINMVAPPPLLAPPANMPAGIYTQTTSLCTIEFGQTNCTPLPGQQTYTVTTPQLFATQIGATLSAACELYGGDEVDPNGPDGDEGFICSTAYTPYKGTQFTVVLTVAGPGVSYILTYTLTKTG